MVDWTRIDGTSIPSGVSIDPGALAASVVGTGTITEVNPGDQHNTIVFTNVQGATSYNLYWKTSAGVTKSDNKITGVTSPYDHTGLTNGLPYYYAYTALVDNVESELSNEVSGTPVAPAPPYPLVFALRA